MKISIALAFIGSLLFQQVSAQVGNCDSLQIINMKLNPFDTDFLMVRAGYTDFDNFINYPGFSVTDEDEFILALEEVNYFGMSLEQIHMLEILDLEIEEGQPVDGNLELWSGFFDYLECEYPGPFVWWPQQDCVPLRLTFNLFNEDTIAGEAFWTVFNASGEIEAQESYSISSEESIVNWDFCLEAGCDYQLQITADSLIGPGFSYNLHYSDFLAVGANGIINESTTQSSQFNLYNCTITSAKDRRTTDWVVFPNPARDWFTLVFEEPINPGETLEVFDINGKQVPFAEQSTNMANEMTISCDRWSSGIYQLIRTDADGYRTSTRVVVQ